MNIRQLLEYIINKKVIYSRSGGGAGSIWLIKFENGADIFIYCSWRVECNGHVLATEYDDSTAIVGRLASSVRLLEEKQLRLLSFSISKQNDLVLIFEKGYCVRIFCNISHFSTENENTYNKNWEFSVKEWNICANITNHFQVDFDKYDTSF